MTDWCGVNDEDHGGQNYTAVCSRSLYQQALKDVKNDFYCLTPGKAEDVEDDEDNSAAIWFYNLLLWRVTVSSHMHHPCLTRSCFNDLP